MDLTGESGESEVNKASPEENITPPPLTISEAEYAILCREDFVVFVVEAFRQMHPGVPYEDCSHMRYICSLLVEHFLGTRRRLCVNLPPRSLKSFAFSVAFVAWVLGKSPATKFICVSYGATLAEKLAADFLRLIHTEWYQRVFKLRLTREKITDIETYEGGGRFSAGIDGAYTGRGADFIIIDDPTKPEEALSDNTRDAVNHIVDTKLRSRLDNPLVGRMALVQQRLHTHDLTGHVTAKEKWTLVAFPAIAERDEDITFETCLGLDRHKRSAGEALQPKRMPLELLKEMEANLGTVAFQAQYQQQPIPPGGNIVKEQWIHRFGAAEEPEPYEYLVQSWDTASTIGQASAYSVCMTFGVYQKKIYLLGCLRQQMEFPALQNAIKVEWERAPQRPSYVLIEEKSSGIALIQVAKTFEIPVVGIKPKDPKDVRLQIVSPMIENGTVLFPRHTPWIDGLISELVRFPQCAYSDQVDALSQALAWLQQRLSKVLFEFDFGN